MKLAVVLRARAQALAPSASYWPLELDLRRFPPIECMIGYGSGIFRQKGYSQTKRPMVDLVFVVKDEHVADWHKENIRAHPGHYSGLLRALGPGAVAAVQGWGPGLYYNPGVSLPTAEGGAVQAKYGVISDEALERDLRNWDSLYIAGRLHKPCLLDLCGKDPALNASIEAAVAANRRAALSAALLECGSGSVAGASPRLEPLSLFSLLSALVQLSYGGDVRAGIAENPSKVANIVLAQHELLCEIYGPIARGLDVALPPPSPDVAAAEDGDLHSRTVDFDFSDEGRRRLFQQLPEAIQQRVAAAAAARGEEPWASPAALRSTLRDIVRRSSAVQTGKGVLTAGPLRGAAYALQKVRKRFAA